MKAPHLHPSAGVNGSRCEVTPDIEGHERSLLSYLMNREGACIELSYLTADDFESPPHRLVFSAIAELYSTGVHPVFTAVCDRLEKLGQLVNVGGRAEVTTIALQPDTPAIVNWALQCVLDNASARAAIAVGEKLATRDICPEDACAQLSKLQRPRSAGQLPGIEDAADFLETEIELPSDLIAGLLHRGSKMVLGGGSKSFKTWQMADMAVCVAGGVDWLGYRTQQGRVLYINLELPGPFFRRRVQTLSREREITIASGFLDIWNLRGYAADLSSMIRQILEKAGTDRYDLIIIDPIYKVMGYRDENKAGDIASLLNEIDRLAVASGAAVVFGAHFSKGNQSGKESIDRIGGSGVFARDPDSILIFTRHEEDDAFTVQATLRNHPPIDDFVVRWAFPLMQRDDRLDPSRLKQATGRTKQHHASDLLALLNPDDLATAEWKDRARDEYVMSERTFYRLLKELKDADLIQNVAGKWTTGKP